MDIQEHFLVPKHSKASEKDKQELMKRFGVDEEGLKRILPKILQTDPGISHLEVKAGDIIKIARQSETAGQTVYYRVVIK